MSVRVVRGVSVAVLMGAVLSVPASSAAVEDGPTYVRPGAPGEPSQVISAADVAVVQQAPYSEAEMHFMQHMIVHHGQAREMAAMVTPERGADERVERFAAQIDITQDGEIQQMERWLRIRDEQVPDEDYAGTPFHQNMPGMVSDEDMAALEASQGSEFDVRFLEAMIEHHEGAIVMVEELVADTGDVLEPTVRIMSMDIAEHQSTEIKRMELVLSDLRGGA